MKKNNVIIWLHMHQPDYADPISRRQYLPWVRRHTLNGYYTVAKLLEEIPAKLNINFSGILLKQILDYAENGLEDYYATLEKKPADSLSGSEIDFITQHFVVPIYTFHSKRFTELLNKKENREKFSKQDIRDAQALFSLSAFSPLVNDIGELKTKDRNFSENDKQFIKETETKIIKSTLPIYRKLYESKQIELTVTPFHHPILPLLIDTNAAKESKKDTILPYEQFSHREDAVNQIKMALEIFKNVFGKLPDGMWPAEGSISNEALDLIRDSGIKWAGTDEAVLHNSRSMSPHDPYIWNVRNVKILFRDHALSDRIGFVYNKMKAEDAAQDFYNAVQQSENTKVVILDGENPWDFYEDNGIEFLKEWFNKVKDITILGSEANPDGELNSIHPGSWINGFFDTWIGHRESNIAWDYLTNAREVAGNNKNAMEELYAAEGSDSFWWYSDFHKKEVDCSFDYLFRMHLIKAYQYAGAKIPEYLQYPIKEVK
jgi:alpha-amylase/alpha-mannosidase (GH57 family)